MTDDIQPNDKQNEVVEKINRVLPKIPLMRWGALTNIYPTNAKLQEMNRLLPHDKKWHLLYEEKDQVNVDGVTIRRKKLDSMT